MPHPCIDDFHYSNELLLFVPLQTTFKNVKIVFKFLVEILLEKMIDFDNSVTKFEEDVNTRLEDLEVKHKAELAELCRLQKSYQRYLKRHYPNIKQGENEAGDKYPVHSIGGNRVGHSET